jgi:DNA-directed RNA polymerase specialized sigma24 family protein
MLHAEVPLVTNRNEEEHVTPAYNQPAEHSPLELQTVMGVEKVLKKVRAFTCLVIGNRVEADEIVEDALILYLSTDPDPQEADGAYAYLIGAVRRLLRTTGARARRGSDLDEALAPLLQLPLETREIAALHLGAGLPVGETASLLGLTAEVAAAALDVVRKAIGPDTYDKAAASA